MVGRISLGVPYKNHQRKINNEMALPYYRNVLGCSPHHHLHADGMGWYDNSLRNFQRRQMRFLIVLIFCCSITVQAHAATTAAHVAVIAAAAAAANAHTSASNRTTQSNRRQSAQQMNRDVVDVKAIVKCNEVSQRGCCDNYCSGIFKCDYVCVPFAQAAKQITGHPDAKVVGVNEYEDSLYITWQDNYTTFATSDTLQ